MHLKGRAISFARDEKQDGKEMNQGCLQSKHQPLLQPSSSPINVFSCVSTLYVFNFKHLKCWTNKHNLPKYLSNYRKSNKLNE